MNAHPAVHYVHFSSKGVFCLFICLFGWIFFVMFPVENLADNLILKALGTIHHMAHWLYVSYHGTALILLLPLHSNCRRYSGIKKLQDLRHLELYFYFYLYIRSLCIRCRANPRSSTAELFSKTCLLLQIKNIS